MIYTFQLIFYSNTVLLNVTFLFNITLLSVLSFESIVFFKSAFCAPFGIYVFYCIVFI